MKLTIHKAAMILAIGLAITACKAKVTAKDGGSKDPIVAPFTDDVVGPKADGNWKSTCEPDKWSTTNGFVIFDVAAKGRQVVRLETKYSDYSCTTVTETIVRDGQFRYVHNHGNDIFEVEYRFKMPNGTYDIPENIRVTPTALWISDRYAGKGVNPDIPLYFYKP